MTQAIPTTGDAVALFQTLLQATWVGLVSDPNTPPMMGATMEMVNGQAVITTDVLIGPKGDKGDSAPMIKLHWPAPADAGSLPSNWGPDLENHGFLIGGLVYVWDGDEWHSALPGPQGPTGATPNLTITYETIPMEERTPEVIAAGDQVERTGSTLNPHYHIRGLSPQGPQGEMGPVEQLTNYDTSKPKATGRVLTVQSNGTWAPSDMSTKRGRIYSIPEQAFSPFVGFAQTQNILAYTIEAQDFDWVPEVFGHLKARGTEFFDSDPISIGCEVRLGNALSGQLIGRGFGNNSNWVQIMPHFSEPTEPAVAVAPGNGVAVVPAGQVAQIFVNLYNDGIFGHYRFDTPGAQLSVKTVTAY